MTKDHDEAESWKAREVFQTHNPVRNATRTVSTATGSSSESELQQLTAAAAKEPVHNPVRTHASVDEGYFFPSPSC